MLQQANMFTANYVVTWKMSQRKSAAVLPKLNFEKVQATKIFMLNTQSNFNAFLSSAPLQQKH